jgi:hypothetical protein
MKPRLRLFILFSQIKMLKNKHELQLFSTRFIDFILELYSYCYQIHHVKRNSMIYSTPIDQEKLVIKRQDESCMFIYLFSTRGGTIYSIGGTCFFVFVFFFFFYRKRISFHFSKPFYWRILDSNSAHQEETKNSIACPSGKDSLTCI